MFLSVFLLGIHRLCCLSFCSSFVINLLMILLTSLYISLYNIYGIHQSTYVFAHGFTVSVSYYDYILLYKSPILYMDIFLHSVSPLSIRM